MDDDRTNELQRFFAALSDEERIRVAGVLAGREATTQELARSREHLMLLGRHTALERVGVFLLSLNRRMGHGELAMGRQDMADYLGLTIETVSRMLSQLQAEGLVEFIGARRYHLLRPERLKAWADA